MVVNCNVLLPILSVQNLQRHDQFFMVTVKLQIFVRYPFSYFWLETGSYELIFVLSRASRQNYIEIRWPEDKNKISSGVKFRTFFKSTKVGNKYRTKIFDFYSNKSSGWTMWSSVVIIIVVIIIKIYQHQSAAVARTYRVTRHPSPTPSPSTTTRRRQAGSLKKQNISKNGRALWEGIGGTDHGRSHGSTLRSAKMWQRTLAESSAP